MPDPVSGWHAYEKSHDLAAYLLSSDVGLWHVDGVEAVGHSTGQEHAGHGLAVHRPRVVDTTTRDGIGQDCSVRVLTAGLWAHVEHEVWRHTGEAPAIAD